MTLVDRVPAVAGQVGRPRQRPLHLLGDRAYASRRHRVQLCQRGIAPCIARRGQIHGSGLGVYRWVVECTFAWLHQFRRLWVRYERLSMIHEAFLWFGCILITWRFLENGF
jgi:transposase